MPPNDKDEDNIIKQAARELREAAELAAKTAREISARELKEQREREEK